MLITSPHQYLFQNIYLKAYVVDDFFCYPYFLEVCFLEIFNENITQDYNI